MLFTCKFNGVPCLLIKCVSDSLYGGSGEYDKNSDKAAQHFLRWRKVWSKNCRAQRQQVDKTPRVVVKYIRFNKYLHRQLETLLSWFVA